MFRHILPLLGYLALTALAVRFTPTSASGELLVVVRADGNCRVAGRALDAGSLRQLLAGHADRARDGAHRYRPSESSVLLRVDPETRWGAVFGVLRACSAPEVRIWRVRLAFPGPGLPLNLPLDRERMIGYEIVEHPAEPEVWVTLRRAPGETQTRVVLMDRPQRVSVPGYGEVAYRLVSLPLYLAEIVSRWSSAPTATRTSPSTA